MQLAHTAEGREEDVMVGRVLGDQHCAGYAGCSVGMLLKRRIPKELRIVLPAHRKADLGCARIARECEREADRHRVAVRTLAGTLEGERVRTREARGTKL